MKDWRKYLNFNPLFILLSIENNAIFYFIKQDLLEEKMDLIEEI